MNIQSIPAHIIEAERTVSQWFAENNIEHWELGKSQSRSFYIPLSYAGVIMWIGDLRVTQTLAEPQIRLELYPGLAIAGATQQCLDDVARILRSQATNPPA